MSSSSTQASQPVTPELRKWIVDQAQAGHSAESVLRAMVASGWNEDVAIAAMEDTLQGFAGGRHLRGREKIAHGGLGKTMSRAIGCVNGRD